MLRRLISAVFVLSLVLALNGTAISDVGKGELNPVIKINPSHERYITISDARPEQPTFKKPEDALKVLPPGTTAPTPPYFLDVQDYTNGVPYYFWTIPDAYGDDLFNMRFTSDAGYDCEVIKAHYLMYGDVMVGTPDMRCYIWDDDMFGFPGAKLDSVDIPYATLLANTVPGIGYVTADFTFDWYGNPASFVFSDGEEHHLGWTILQSDPGDVLAILSDDAGPGSSLEERASENWGGMWGTMLNDWSIDISFFILNERDMVEIPYTDCYWQSYAANLAYFWKAPHPDWGDVAYAMRYDVGGRETLQFIDILIYADHNAPATFGNDTVFMTVYDDDGAGLPGAQIAQAFIPPGGYVAYPAWQRFDFDYVLTPQNNITMNEFHIAFSSSAIFGSGEYECCMSSDGTDGTGRSSSDWGGPYWVDFLSGWGLDANFIFDARLCKDEYYECAWDWCDLGPVYFWRLPDIYGDYAQAQKFPAPGADCQVMDVCWMLYDNGDPDIYTYQSLVEVCPDAGGLPGAPIASIPIGPGTAYPYVTMPAWMVVEFEPLGITVTGDYWVAITSLAPDEPTGIRTMSDAGGGGCMDSYAENWMGMWELMWPVWSGLPADVAAVVKEKQCCIPFGGLDCYPSEDWPTYQRDYARTGHSMNAVDDAWCDLTLNWNYTHPTLGSSYPSHGPIIAYDRVVMVYSSGTTAEYKVFDLVSGTLLYTLSGAPDIGYSIQCTPTVDMIAGYPDPILFTSGGNRETISAWNFNTGALIWSRTASADKYGTTTYGRFIVLDLGGYTGLFWGTDDGYVVGADALTGATLPGYPVPLTLPTTISGATDGTRLFYNTYGGSGSGAVEGDVYAINAATGAIIWSLYDVNSGLSGKDVWADTAYFNSDEGFTAGIMYDNGNIYTNSRAEGYYPVDGLFYSINAATGVVNYAALSNRVYYSTPVMDRNHCYMPTYTRWVAPPAGGNLLKIHKNFGTYTTFTNANGDRYFTDVVISCEPDDGDYPDDLIYAFSEWGFLSCINSVTFEEVYRRRINHGTGYGANIGMGGAIAHDEAGQVHVVFADYYGCLFDMTKQEDRPRLQIETYNPTTAVEFADVPEPEYGVSWDDVFYNSGCAELLFDYVDADEDACPGMYIPEFASAVDPNFMDRAEKIADNLARDAFLSKYLRANSNVLDESGMHSVREMDLEKETINRAAAGWPGYLVRVDWPQVGSVLPAGAYHSLDLTVNQGMISRGAQCFYLAVGTNDPDFFLNNIDLDPCLYVCLIGGCLIDTTTLWFGVGSANMQLVTNTGRLGTGDWDPHAFEIDGDDASFYQGHYIYGVDSFRIALHSQDWFSGGGEADGWWSMQPDPNWCDNECHPYLMTDEPYGEITHDDGETYETILVNKVCKSFLDSVQDFSLGGTVDWNWRNFNAPLDDTLSMGIYCNAYVIGAIDIPELHNVTVEVMEFFERNGNSVPDWKFGVFIDYDVGGDTADIDRSISTAWSYTPGSADAAAWGVIKLPFGGCGQEPLKNVWALDADQAQFNNSADVRGNAYLDSAYYYMTQPPGAYGHDVSSAPQDQEFHATLVEHDFAPYDTIKFAVAHFGYASGIADPSDPAEYAPLAKLVNKWVGFGRGDVNNDGAINLCDIVYLAATVNGGPGAIPFRHLGDVNCDGGLPDIADVYYLIDFYFNYGPAPVGGWIF